jgi:C_GCAxxG_C_C family probable redox protein
LDAIEHAAQMFHQGFSCSQAVCAAFAPELELDAETALKISGAFGGGCARQGELCGAVAGAMIVLGMRHGRIKAEDTAIRDGCYAAVQALWREFRARNNGQIDCRDLLGCELGTPEGAAQAKRMEFHTKVCPTFVRDAAEILEKLLSSR